MRFAIFPFHLSKVLRLPRKIDAMSYEVLHLSRKIILANLQIWCSQMQPLSGNLLRTAPMEMSLVLCLPRKMHPCRSCHRFWQCYKTLTFCSLLRRCTIPCACHAKWALNVQKWSVRSVFCTCWLRSVLRATTACTFLISQLPKVVRPWCVLYILTWKRASRHNGVHFFISHHIWPDGSAPAALASLLFDPPEPQIIGKNTVFRGFPTFSRICIFFLLTLSLLIFSLLLFSSLWLFPSLLFICPYCRKFDF